MKFNEKLVRKRKENNLSQEQLADAMGLTRQSVSKWETGDSYPDVAKLIQLCKVLNCHLNDLIDDGVIDEQIEQPAVHSSYLDSFLNYITCIYNMFIHMSLSNKLKMVAEMVVLVLVMWFIGYLLFTGIQFLLSSLLVFIPADISVILIHMIMWIILVALIVIGCLIFLHLFKIRYLDYYVTITDRNITQQVVEDTISENNTNALTKNKDEKVVVIRDPKHTAAPFFEALAKLFGWLFKCLIVVALLPAAIGVIVASGGALFILASNISKLSGITVSFFGAALLCIVILVAGYHYLVKSEQPHRLLLVGMIVSLLLIGAGGGGGLYQYADMDYCLGNENLKIKTETVTFASDDYDSIYIYAGNITYHETSDDKIKIVFSFPTDVYFRNTDYSGGDGEKSIEYYFEADELRLLMDDLKQGQRRSSYSGYYLATVDVYCNEANFQKLKLY